MNESQSVASDEVLLIVRACVSSPAEKSDFDRWYAGNHAPLAARLLGAARAWRFWSLTEGAVHYAVYSFRDETTLRRALESPEAVRLMAEFDDRWPQGVTRTRDIIRVVDRFE